MRAAAVTLLATFSFLASAQLLDQLPKCAQDCYGRNTGNCGALDIKCICGNSTLIEGLSCCVASTCNSQDQNTTIMFAKNLCEANGVTVPTSASCAASSPTSTGGSATQSGQSSGTPTQQATSSPSSTGAAAIHTGIGIGLGLGMAGLFAAL
ncbi:uncharacterized protein EI97DRAFT_428922 [Westerdykella ornata]|uniref:CFEM domain-containing protein n=1 Tax=Westerdykella ornata TaxID=318751 RepID=A0A6A6JYA6_WESOR|nr:uncharacterized protein EI97DRAFT_428922 [Westerdykella ornata]KAF2280828.1 hypothetical protein EI97DRAFT_428922 [Westerdykella ornata]